MFVDGLTDKKGRNLFDLFFLPCFAIGSTHLHGTREKDKILEAPNVVIFVRNKREDQPLRFLFFILGLFGDDMLVKYVTVARWGIPLTQTEKKIYPTPLFASIFSEGKKKSGGKK